MQELLQNPYFIGLTISLVFVMMYVVFRPEYIPSFIFVLVAGTEVFFSLANLQKVALLRAIILPLLFLILLIHRMSQGKRIPLGNLSWLFLYMITITASMLLNGTDPNDYRAVYAILLIPFVIALCPNNEKTVKYLTITIALWGLANFLAVLAQWSGHGWSQAYTGSAIYTKFRALGLMGQATSMGIYFVICLNAVHVLYYQARNKVMRILLLGLGIGMVLGLVGTLSRGAFIAWLVSFFFIQNRLRGLSAGKIFGIAVASTVVILLALLLNLDEMMLGRFSNIDVDPSAQARIPLLEMGARLLNTNLVFGVSLGQGGGVHLEAHNTYMQVLMENGIVGFTLFCTILWKGIRGLRLRARASANPQMQKATPYNVGLLGSGIAILVDAASHVFDYYMPLWLILGISYMV